ncbi:MAG: acyl-CoA/acyl-ACP dehydrogenase [Actinomycetota bacterium]|nr:acyl-CoA/acyl-ACP dehydrogenase [Actinomycetota bacterium]
MTARHVALAEGALPPELGAYFAERAEAVDRGTAEVRDGLRRLADHGLLAHPDLATSCAVLEEVARRCLASAFSAWAHTVVAEYLSLSSSAALRAEVPRLRRAETIGSTAMAPAMQHLVGLADLGVGFRHDGASLVVDGAVRWASNLFAEGFLVVVGAAGPGGTRAVLAIASDAPGVHAGAPLELLALGATRSSSLRFDGVALDPSWVVSTDFEPFLRAVKPRFLLLQSSFCLGLARAALEAAEAGLGRSFAAFRREHHRLRVDLDMLGVRHRRLIEGVGPTPAVVAHRLEVARMARLAVDVELGVAGGGGYRASSPTARRLREAAFLPIQSPTEGHLRFELESAASNEEPTPVASVTR